jgi:hypothetical protein
VVVLGLFAFGVFRVGGPSAQPANDGQTAKKDDAGGRYRIEPADDIRGLLGKAGGLGFLGDRATEAWVFKYSGGFVECGLEAETFGQSSRGATMPDNWARVLASDDAVQAGDPEAFRKEGYIVVAAMAPVMSMDEAMESYYPHLGGLFGVGPAGPLNQLTTAHLDSSHWRFYRILITSSAPSGMVGAGHNLWTAHQVNVRLPLLPRDLASEEEAVGGGKDLEAGKEVTLIDRHRGLTRIRVKARFLPDPEVREQAAKSPR